MRELYIYFKDGDKHLVNVYTVDEYIGGVFFRQDFETAKKRQKNGAVEYINVPFTFDIETSYIDREERFTYMYHWQMTVGGEVICGRTWDEWERLLLFLHDELCLSEQRVARIFIHNLPYEWQFFHSRLPIANNFARQPHEPIVCRLGGEFTGIEFLCTYSISGYSLESLAASNPKIPIDKKTGDIDHTITRTSETALTDAELGYCVADVLILHYYVEYLIDNERRHNVGDIPITKTGFVRRDCRREVTTDPAWRKLFLKTALTAEQFIYYNKAFRGGDTHAAPQFCGCVLSDVFSFDLTSSYPSRMVFEDFPLSKAVTISNPSVDMWERIRDLGYLYVAEITLRNVRLKSVAHFPYIPVSKCSYLFTTAKHNGVKYTYVDNGRVTRTPLLTFCATSVDWDIIFENYDFDIDRVNFLLYHYTKGKLPDIFRHYVLRQYVNKTKLKGVPNMETEYALSKERVNSLYGMCVTNPLNDEIVFTDGEWFTHQLSITTENETQIQQELNAYYSNFRSFLPYQFGVWVTAYARADLHRALSKIGVDAVYWDTDSCKTNGDYSAVFAALNADKMAAINASELPRDMLIPQTIKGEEKPLGLWDCEYDGKPVEFKTYGSKKYMVRERDGRQSITVAGLNKKKAVPYIVATFGDVFSVDIGDVIPAAYSGRTFSQMIEKPRTEIIDGVEHTEYSYHNIIPTTYRFGDTDEHLLYCLEAKENVKERRKNGKDKTNIDSAANRPHDQS